ncbi:phage tail domain-containing protein [Enterococcus sp. DIV1420a]|uniref:phage tail domain-containing protein n=1 Tax=Enterococcus sp. DIV1420a TaxID=2774672 RepID=UPI003F279F11
MELELIYTNRNKEQLVFKEEAPYFLQNIEGLEAPENIILSEEVFGEDGAKVVGIRLSTRKPLIEGTLVGKTEEEIFQLRRDMIQKIDLKQPGKLTLKIYGKEYETDVLPIQAPSFKLYEDSPQKVDELNLFSLQFESFAAYLRDVSFYNSLVPLATLKPTLIFPLVFIHGQTHTFGRFESGNIEKICNNGDVQVGAIFYLKCVATVTNPQIYDVTKQTFFGFQGTYAPGTRFELSTVRGHLYAKKIINGVETNAVPERMSGSNFFRLSKGDNYLQLKAANHSQNGITCEMQFTPLVSGV